MSHPSPPEFSNTVPAGWVTLKEINRRCARRGVLPPPRTVLHLGERLAAALAYVERPPHPDQPSPPVLWDASSCHVLLGPGGRVGMSVDSTSSPQTAQPDDSQDRIAKLGNLLYETLTGVTATSLQAENEVSILDPSSHRPDVSADLDAALMGCIHPKADQPIPSAEAFGDLLAQLLRQSAPPSPDSTAGPAELGTCKVTALFLLALFPNLSSHSTLRGSPAGEAPPWLPLAHLTPRPKLGPNVPTTPVLTSEDVLLGNEWDLSESDSGLENNGSSALNQGDHEGAARQRAQQPLDRFIERRGEQQDLYVESSDTPHRLLWAALAILGPLAILAIGQAFKH